MRSRAVFRPDFHPKQDGICWYLWSIDVKWESLKWLEAGTSWHLLVIPEQRRHRFESLLLRQNRIAILTKVAILFLSFLVAPSHCARQKDAKKAALLLRGCLFINYVTVMSLRFSVNHPPWKKKQAADIVKYADRLP